jgi:hypothetical protein
MLNKFVDGQEVHAVLFPDASKLERGEGECDKIIVSLEGNVPWFCVMYRNKITAKWNSMMTEGVIFEEGNMVQ